MTRNEVRDIVCSNTHLSVDELMRMTGAGIMQVFNHLMDTKIDEMAKLVEYEFGKEKVPKKIRVSYSLKEYNVLGKAYTDINLIKLDMDLIKRYKEYYIKHTFAHEYAHLVVEKIFPKHRRENGTPVDPHGNTFRYVCRLFGINGDSHSDLDFLSSAPLSQKFVPGS